MPEPTHNSYMLRLWRERGEAPWRVTLIAVAQPDQQRQFDTLEDCFAFFARAGRRAEWAKRSPGWKHHYCSADASA